MARSPLSNAACHAWSCLAAGVSGNLKWDYAAAPWDSSRGVLSISRDRVPRSEQLTSEAKPFQYLEVDWGISSHTLLSSRSYRLSSDLLVVVDCHQASPQGVGHSMLQQISYAATTRRAKPNCKDCGATRV